MFFFSGECVQPGPVVVPANQNQLSPADQPDVAAGYKHAARDDGYYEDEPQATFFNTGYQPRPQILVAFLVQFVIVFVHCRWS